MTVPADRFVGTSSANPEASASLAGASVRAASTEAAVPSAMELPEGWRDADDMPREYPRPARGRRTLLIVAVVFCVSVCVVGLSSLIASSHYRRGVEAMRYHSYAWAAHEFAAAKVLFIPYRDAASRAEQARKAEATARAARDLLNARVAAVGGALAKARDLLDEQRSVDLLGTLRDVQAKELAAAVAASRDVSQAADRLTADLVANGRQSLAARQYVVAARYARAALLLSPGDAATERVLSEAKAGAALSAKLATAKKAAGDGRWRKALRLALAVLKADKDFPGAATVVARARKALKPPPERPAVVTAPATRPVAPVAVQPSPP